MSRHKGRFWFAGLVLLGTTASCVGNGLDEPPRVIRYVGSSTVAVFLRRVEAANVGFRFELDTAPESAGGELAIQEARADLAGIATTPSVETLREGVVSTLIGHDAIAVIVHSDNPVRDLSTEQLRGLFTGAIRDWSEVGGEPIPVRPYIVGTGSATRSVFQRTVLGGAEYTGCEEVQPDRALIERVAQQPGGIGHISFSLLPAEASGVSPVSVDSQVPLVTNPDYPIERPLFLLWRESDPDVERFVAWAQSNAGQRLVMLDFIGERVVEAESSPSEKPHGTLVVQTAAYPVWDGGIFYYPHHPYEILTRYGEPIRRVRNHRVQTDEQPTRVKLPPGVYLIRPQGSPGDPEFFVRVQAGQTTVLDVEEELRRQ